MIAERQLVEQKDPILEISRRIANMETHIINMIIPLQSLSQTVDPEFLKSLQKLAYHPLTIDDSGLKQVLSSFQKTMEKFSKGTCAVDPDQVYDKLKELYGFMITQNVQNDRILRKLDELEKKVDKQKVFVTVSGIACENNPSLAFTEEQEAFLSSYIRDEETTVRLANLLHKEKFKTWKAIWTYGKVNFYKIERFGKKAVVELEEIFNRYDITF